MSTPWPPPPDLDSIQQLVREADTEHFIAEGAPADEYDHEAAQLYAAIAHLSTADLTAPNILPHIESIWARSFSYDAATRASAASVLGELARQIARFFGPDAQPQVREQNNK